MKYHTRHEYIAQTGKRISRGAWERLNRAYNVHLMKQKWVWGPEGKPHVVGCFTHTIMNETPKAFRKLGMRERFRPEGTKRARFTKQNTVGHTR